MAAIEIALSSKVGGLTPKPAKVLETSGLIGMQGLPRSHDEAVSSLSTLCNAYAALSQLTSFISSCILRTE